jgi:hypothetical protein
MWRVCLNNAAKQFLLGIGFGITLAFQPVNSQTKAPKELASRVSGPVPIVFGKRDDGLPETLALHGTIEDLAFSQAGCGVVAWSGTLKVKLTQPIAAYSHDSVFIVLTCFPDFEEFKDNRALYIGRSVSLKVSKLYPEYRFGVIKDIKKAPCAFGLINNSLDSKKVPFYCTRENISESIKANENQQKVKGGGGT